MVIKGKNILNRIYDVFEKLMEWFNANNLVVNFDKTCIVNFTPHILFFNNFIFKGDSIRVVQTAKYLGVMVDCGLLWHDHVQFLMQKLKKAFFPLRRLSRIVEPNIVLYYYYAQVHSVLKYGLTSWGQTSHLRELFTIQKKIVRIVFNKPYNYHCKNLFVEKGILTVSSMYIYEVIKEGIQLGILTLERMSPRHGYQTRHCFMYKDRVSTLEERLLKNKALTFFNYLSKERKVGFKENTVNMFLSNLKLALSEKAYYSLDEFFADPI